MCVSLSQLPLIGANIVCVFLRAVPRLGRGSNAGPNSGGFEKPPVPLRAAQALLFVDARCYFGHSLHAFGGALVAKPVDAA